MTRSGPERSRWLAESGAATQINLWKKQLLEGAESIFEGDRKPEKDTSDEPQVAELYEQIGRLKVELEWLKKKVAQDSE